MRVAVALSILVALTLPAAAGEFCASQVVSAGSSGSGFTVVASDGIATIPYGSSSISYSATKTCVFDAGLNSAIRQQLEPRLPKQKAIEQMSEGQLYEVDKELKKFEDWSDSKSKSDNRIAEQCRQRAYREVLSQFRGYIASRCAALKIDDDARLILPTLPELPK